MSRPFKPNGGLRTPITTVSPEQLRGMALAEGSMGPKVEAACDFVESGLGFAGIGAVEDAAAIAKGEAGTIIATPVS